jgi:hypothetical protein
MPLPIGLPILVAPIVRALPHAGGRLTLAAAVVLLLALALSLPVGQPVARAGASSSTTP